MAASAVAIPYHISHGSVTIPKDINSVMTMDKLSPSKQDTLCERCSRPIIPGTLTCEPCLSRKRKHSGRERDSSDIKRRSIPSPAESSLALSPESLDGFDVTMDRQVPGSMSEEHAVFIGSTTEFESSLFSILDMSHLRGQSTSFVERGSSLFSVDHELAASSQASRVQATRKVISSVGSSGSIILINAYEKHIHNSFPVVADEFLANVRHGRLELLEPTLLAAIYATALPWVEMNNFMSAPNIDNIAFGLFTKMLPAPSIHIIQAGLLLMQRPDVDSKTLNSQAISAAYEIGLHLDCSTWTSISQSEKRLRRRLAWALYMQDTWCSLIHGRPAWIDRDNWAVTELTENDLEVASEAETEESSSQLLFLQLIALTKILSSILDTFYTLKAIQEIESRGENGTRLILEKAKPVQIRLKSWFSGLPPVLKMDSIESYRPTAIGLLHLAYFATEITLHRCIIRSLETSNTDAYLAHICRSAAKTRLISAMDFVNRLRPEHLQAFWYFPSSVSFALIASFGSLLLATAPSLEEQEFYQTRLNEYRWTVGVSSRTAPLLCLALETLDHGENMLRNLPAKPPSSEIAVSIPEPATTVVQPTFTGPGEEFDSDDSGETMDGSGAAGQAQLQGGNSGLMSPSNSTEDGIDLNRGYGAI